MFCISLANQIHVIQRQPFFSIRPPHLPSIITFNRLTFCQKKNFSNQIKIRLIVRHEKEKKSFSGSPKKESIIMKPFWIVTFFLIERKYFKLKYYLF